MSTLKTHNLQSSDSGSVNIALTPNAGMVVTGISTFSDIDVDGHTDLDNVNISGITTIIGSGLRIGANGIKRETIHLDAGDSNQTYIRFTNTGTGNGTADGLNIGIDADENSLMWNFENKDSIFATNNQERLRIHSNGQVQIGGTTLINSDPLLTLGQSASAVGAQFHLVNNGSADLKQIFISAGKASRHIGIDVSTNNFFIGRDGVDSDLVITSGGNLGIGTTNPLTTLHVRGTTHALGNGGAALVWGNTTSLGTLSYSGSDALVTAANNLIINVNGSERLRITSYGDAYTVNSAYNTFDNAATSVNTIVEANENRSGVYWLNFNGQKFRAYVKANWLQGRNWVLAAKYFDCQDMPSGSSLWTNDTYVNESDFNLYGGIMSKYRSWRYFSFNRLAMQMGNRIPPIMQFNSNQTLYGAFSGGLATNGGGVTADSTDPAMSGSTVTYHSMNNYAGPDFHDVQGLEDRMQSYGLNKWANAAINSTSGNNQGSENYYPQHRIEAGGGASADFSLDIESVKGFRMTIEDSHPNLTGVDSVGRAGAWIGCPLDEGNSRQGDNSSNNGADSGFGLGGCCGNNARTWTSGYAEWNLGNSVVNCLPAYIWLSID